MSLSFQLLTETLKATKQFVLQKMSANKNYSVSMYNHYKNLFDQKKKLEEIGDRDSLEINKCLTSIFKTLENSDYFARNKINVNDLTKGGELFYDAYGSPLYFMNTNSLLFKKINHERIMEWGTHYPFVVWSAGKNKINEFGYGDDIMPYQ